MLSVIIITQNEEGNIRACLESIQWADEIIVVDSGSQDNTVSIAREFTEHVYCTDWQGYGIQKQRALAYATQEWVLNLDADETVDASLKRAIQTAIKSTSAEAYRVPIRMQFYGKLLRYSSCPRRHIRLFKRTGAHYSSDIVHEKIILPSSAKIKQFKLAIRHHSFQDVSHALEKLNRYSSYTAKIRIHNSTPPAFFKILLATAWMFSRCYLLQGGFLDGRAGFLFAILSAQGTFYRGVKQLYHDLKLNQLPKALPE